MQDTKLRVFCLLELLRQTDENHPRTAAALAAGLGRWGIEACVRTVNSDLRALRDAGYCIPVHHNRRRGCYLAEHTLEDHELKLLMDMAAEAPFLTAQDTNRLLKKLRALGSPTAGRVAERTLILDVARKTDNVQAKIAMHVILTAIAQGKQLQFEYMHYDSCAGSRPALRSNGGRYYRVSPYYTAYREGQYYLLGNLDGHEGLSTFRIENMLRPALCGDPSRPRRELTAACGDFDAAAYLRRAVDMYGGAPVQLTLLCAPGAATVVRDRFGRKLWAKSCVTNDRFRVEVEACESDGLYRWLMAHADEIMVLGPPGVRDALRKRLEAALAGLLLGDAGARAESV